MSLKVLSKVAGSLNNETLGTVVVGMVEDGELSVDAFGAMVRTALSAGCVPSSPSTPTLDLDAILRADAETPAACCGVAGPVEENAVASAPAPTGAPLPESATTRAALLRTVYDSFADFRRRSVEALSRTTGLTEDAVLQLIDGNSDFRVTTGRDTGRTFVSVLGLS